MVTLFAFLVSCPGLFLADSDKSDKNEPLPQVVTIGGATLPFHGDPSKLCYKLDGKVLITGHLDYLVRCWDPKSGTCIKELKGAQGSITAVAASPDGIYVVAGGYDDTIRIWQAKSGELVRSINAHKGGVHSVAVSPDGKRIASGGGDNDIVVWQLDSGEEVARCKGHKRVVLSVFFAKDGMQIVSGSADGTVRLWDIASSKETTLISDDGFDRDLFCGRQNRRLCSAN